MDVYNFKRQRPIKIRTVHTAPLYLVECKNKWHFWPKKYIHVGNCMSCDITCMFIMIYEHVYTYMFAGKLDRLKWTDDGQLLSISTTNGTLMSISPLRLYFPS